VVCSVGNEDRPNGKVDVVKSINVPAQRNLFRSQQPGIGGWATGFGSNAGQTTTQAAPGDTKFPGNRSHFCIWAFGKIVESILDTTLHLH
jgi:hypothetical protein